MPSFKDLKRLEKFLQEKINNALISDVADTVREVEIRQIEETVYDAYTPKMYRRRGNWGGLADPHNIEAEVIDDGVLKVWNETPPNEDYDHSRLTSKFIDVAVETGREYTFFSPGPRPFTKNTADELREKEQHISALVKGLRRQGITIK